MYLIYYTKSYISNNSASSSSYMSRIKIHKQSTWHCCHVQMVTLVCLF